MAKADLTAQEKRHLASAERVIERLRQAAIEAAKALLQIRDERLYRAEYATFDDYCKERWGFDRVYGHRLCSWAEVAENLLPTGNIPESERHARPLAGLRPEVQRKAWQVALKSGGRLTAETVKAAVIKVTAPKPPALKRNVGEGHIIVADAVEGMRTLADRSVNLCLFSPPYCQQRQGHYPGVDEKDFPNWMTTVLEAARPKLTSNGSVMIVAREHLRDGQISDVWLRTRLAIRAAGWIEAETLIWHKPDAPPLGSANRPRRAWEYVFWFSLTRRPFVDLLACGRDSDRIGWVGSTRYPHLHSQTFQLPVNGRARVTDVVVAATSGTPDGIAHPATFPPSLAEQLVQTYSPSGGLVIDPMCGSGTTLLAAKKYGRKWWGCDIVQSYVDLAGNRMATCATA